MKTIFKYEIPDKGANAVKMPKNHIVLTAQCQYGTVKIWAIVDSDDENYREVTFHVIGTGKPIPENVKLNYVATILTFAGSEVNHLFEEV